MVLPSPLPKGFVFIYPNPLTFYISSLSHPPSNAKVTLTSSPVPLFCLKLQLPLLVDAYSPALTHTRASNLSSHQAQSPSPYQTQQGTPTVLSQQAGI